MSISNITNNKPKNFTELLEVWMKESGFGRLLETPLEIKGGLMHKMYRVVTAKGIFAVKVLNPEILKRSDALQNIIHSEKAANAFSGLIPAVAALTINGQQVQKSEEDFYLIFPWIEGASVFPGELKEEHCRAIGAVLGKIHQQKLEVKGILPETNSFKIFDWDAYAYSADKWDGSTKEWIPVYKTAVDNVKNWNIQACHAKEYLSKTIVISHRDLDPKNVIWNGGCPYIIDWEAAGYVNPYQEFIEAVNYWADNGNSTLITQNFYALQDAYCKYIDIHEVQWEKVLAGSQIGMLGWLEYNVRRALGIEASNKAEMHLGEKQVIQTIHELYAYQEKIIVLKKLLAVNN